MVERSNSLKIIGVGVNLILRYRLELPMDFSQLAILLVVAASFGLIARNLRQPLLIGYIFAGLFLASTGIIRESVALESFGEIGVTLLLFLLGLEMDLREVFSFGRVAAMGGMGQMALTFAVAFLLLKVFGVSFIPAVYLGMALTFSSTIIVVKLLSEKKDLASLYGKISVGILLMQDFVVIAILMFLSGFGKVGLSFGQYVAITVKGGILYVSVWILSKKILPNFFDRFVSSSQELLYVVSIAWALGVASFVAGPMGFSLEIGGLLAGLSLSGLSEHLQIASKTKPLRDFFLIIFFLLLGTRLVIDREIVNLLPLALALSLFVLIIKPLIIVSILGLLGYKKRTSYLTAISLSQVSEFSLILISTGFAIGHLGRGDVSTITIVGIVTMTISTYLILRAEKIYKKVQGFLFLFERKHTKEEAFFSQSKLEGHTILVGCDRTGRSISAYMIRKNIPFVVVDFNPKVFSRLVAAKIPVVFGDINDPEAIEGCNLVRSKMIISTISNLEDNLTLLEYLRSLRVRPIRIFTAATYHDAVKLYEAGASYVIVPEVVAGEHIRHLLATYGSGSPRIERMGRSHFNRLLVN